MTGAVKRQATLLLGRLGRHEPHVSPRDCLADCLGIGGIVLMPLHIGLNVSWRHQLYGVAQCLQLARPVVRRGASLDADQAWRQLLEERQHVSTLQLPADHHLPISINAVNLKDRLRDIQTNCCDRLHARLLRIVGASTAPTSVALARRWRSRPQHQKPTS